MKALKAIAGLLSLVLTLWLITYFVKRSPLHIGSPPIGDIGSRANEDGQSGRSVHPASLDNASLAEKTASVYSAYLSPILFYGKVFDQYGQPVAGATIQASANSNPAGRGSTQTVQSGADGAFSISGMRGLSLSIEISKPGYRRADPIPGRPGSYGGAKFASIGGESIHHPDRAKPVLFLLYKQGVLEPLSEFRPRRSKALDNGAPIVIDLAQPGATTHREVVVKMWISPKKEAESRTFDWKCEIGVVHGMVAICNGPLDFVAPEEEWHTSEVIDMPSTLAMPEWQDAVNKLYFLRFDDGVYARIKVRAAAFGGGGVSVSGFLNPRVGSRNLETKK